MSAGCNTEIVDYICGLISVGIFGWDLDLNDASDCELHNIRCSLYNMGINGLSLRSEIEYAVAYRWGPFDGSV